MTPKQLSSIARDYGTPTYAYDLDQVKARYTAFSKAFDWPKLKICYAMKANYNPDLLRTLCRAGSGIDAVSPGMCIWRWRWDFIPRISFIQPTI